MDIKYKPFMPYRKFKRTILITKENLGKSMGDINRFFKKPTDCLYSYVDIDSIYYKRNKQFYEDSFRDHIKTKKDAKLIPMYRPYIKGVCEPHWLVKEKSPLITMKTPVLAINSPFEDCCIPIHIGSRYKIFGNRLILIDPYDDFFHSNRYCKPQWLRYHEFIHAKEDDKYNRLCIDHIFDSLDSYLCIDNLDLKEYGYDFDYNMIDRLSINIRNDIFTCKNGDSGEKDFHYELNGKKILLHINIDKWIEIGKYGKLNDIYQYYVEDDKTPKTYLQMLKECFPEDDDEQDDYDPFDLGDSDWF